VNSLSALYQTVAAKGATDDENLRISHPSLSQKRTGKEKLPKKNKCRKKKFARKESQSRVECGGGDGYGARLHDRGN